MKHENPKQIVDARGAGNALVFSLIQQQSPVARIDIAAQTGLSPATVTSITADLLAKGLVSEVPGDPDKTNAKRGRPRVNLKIRGEAHLVAGMKLSDKMASVAILDFEGKRISQYQAVPPAPILTPNEAAIFLNSTLISALAEANLTLADISGVGVGMPGLINAEDGTVHWSPSISERDVPFRAMLNAIIGKPIFLDNDANLVAKAEQRYGVGKRVQNFIVVTVEQGVGMGIVVNGELYRGTSGRGAELGHTKVHLDGALCRCGQRGCLEAYVGDYALLREASTAMGAVAGESVQLQMRNLLHEADSGNEMARTIILRAGRMLSMGLANVVNIFAPELIILSSERMEHNPIYIDAVLDEMRKSVVLMGAEPPKISIHKWDVQMWSLGAAAYAVEGVSKIALKEMSNNAV